MNSSLAFLYLRKNNSSRIPRCLVVVLLALPMVARTAPADPPEPLTSWKYPPEMSGSRTEVYRQVGEVKLKAWIFDPAGHAATDRRPAVVFYFGGGWRGGTPGQFLPHCRYLAERGMVAITVDYRVRNRHDVSPQECLRDAKAAIRWVRSNARRLGVDPNRVAAGGGSAGGHLAAATALINGFEDDASSIVSSAPNAMILFNPAVVIAPVEGHPDLLPDEKFTDIRQRTDGRPREVSPYHFVRSGLPPSIIFHGTEDEAVPFPTVELFHEAMTAAGNRCELKAYQGQPHGFFNPGRKSGEPRAEANRNYHQTIGELDVFLVSLGYLQPATKKLSGFVPLSDGKSFNGWQHDGNWVIQDGAFYRKAKGGSLTYTNATVPDDFELRFDWKVSKGCNSGIYYRPGQVEYQILDNVYSPYGENARQAAGSIFFCMAPKADVTRPFGEWNTGRVICKGTVIEHWLNGERVLSFDYTDSKWAKYVKLLSIRGGDLTGRNGKLWLQDHGQDVWFRSLSWREIPAREALVPDSTFKPMSVTGSALEKEQGRVRGMLERAKKKPAPTK
jgi:acetyl esterase/lipase